MIMDKHDKLPRTDSLLDKLTLRIASGMDDEFKRKLSMQQPLPVENKFIREPTLDIDKELVELENLIRNLQTEIGEMTKKANTPPPEYVPNNEEFHDVSETKINQNIFDSLPPISTNDDLEATFKSLWNSSNPDTSESNSPDVTLSSELRNELQKEIFGDADFMNSLLNVKQGIEPKQPDNVTNENGPTIFEENIDKSKDKNIKTGLIMRIFGPNDNTNKAKNDSLNPSISQKFFDMFSTNKSQTPNIDSNNKLKAENANSSLDTKKNVFKAEPNLSSDLTDGVKKVFMNDSIVPKSQPDITSKIKPNPPKDTKSEDSKNTASIKNIFSKIEQSLVNTIIGNKSNKSSDLNLKNKANDKSDSKLSKNNQSRADVINTHKDSESKTEIAHKLNVINIYIDTPQVDFPPIKSKTSITQIHGGRRGKTSSTSMNRKDINITRLKQTSSTGSVFNDTALRNAIHSSQKTKEAIDSIKKGNSKSASMLSSNNLNIHRDSYTKLSDIDNNSSKLGVHHSNKRPMSDCSVLKSRDIVERPYESMKNEFSKDCEMPANRNVISKVSNTRKPANENDHDCDNWAEEDSFDDCLEEVPDQISNNPQIEKPVIVIQFSEQPNVLEKEIVITKPTSSENNTFKVYTRSNEDLVKDKEDLHHATTGDVEPDRKRNEKNTDKVDKQQVMDDKIRSVLRDSLAVPKSQPIYINSTLITINNIDTVSDEFEDSEDFIQEPTSMEIPKKVKNE